MPYGDLIAVRRVAEAVKAPGWQTRDADDAGKIYSPSLRICWEKNPTMTVPPRVRTRLAAGGRWIRTSSTRGASQWVVCVQRGPAGRRPRTVNHGPSANWRQEEVSKPASVTR
jgi:hypothetical protein